VVSVTVRQLPGFIFETCSAWAAICKWLKIIDLPYPMPIIRHDVLVFRVRRIPGPILRRNSLYPSMTYIASEELHFLRPLTCSPDIATVILDIL